MPDDPHAEGERRILGTELRWASLVAVLVVAIVGVIFYTAVSLGMNPPSNVERIDPKALHLDGEFTEHNLGTTVTPQGEIVARIVATQFAFLPRCIPVPADTRVTLRFSSPDVIHGILVTGTNANTMVIPGYVAQVHTVFKKTGDLLMPCHEYCGLGHSDMWATVQVMPQTEFKPGSDGRYVCAQH